MYDNYNGVLIIPMTISSIDCYNEIIGNLIEDGVEIHHFILNADKQRIKERLILRGECENLWAKQQIDRCLQEFKSNINGENINTNNLSLEQVVNTIMKKLIH